MDRLLLAAAIMVATVGVATFMRYRSTRQLAVSARMAVTATNGHIPSAIAVTELETCGLAPPAGATAFIVVFTEATCRTCAAALQTASGPLGAGLAVIEVEYTAQRDLQKRLRIDTVPTTVVVTGDGAVLAGWSGKIDEVELQATAQLVTNC